MFNNKRDERYYLYLYCLAFRSEGLPCLLGSPAPWGQLWREPALQPPVAPSTCARGTEQWLFQGAIPCQAQRKQVLAHPGGTAPFLLAGAALVSMS